MSEPDDLDKLTEELNAAARSERPTDERKAAILEAILRKGGPRGGGGLPKAVGAVLSALVLLLFGGLAWRGLQSTEEAPTTEPRVIPTSVSPTGGGSTTAPIVPPPPPPDLVEPLTPPEVAPEPPRPPEPPPEVVKRPVPGPVPEEPDALAKEVRLVDAARASLLGDPRGALALLERHRREFPKGALRVEADLVRLEAHLRAGERSKAQSIVDRLTRGAPEGPVAARARRLFEEIP